MNLKDELRILQEIQNTTSTKTFKVLLEGTTITDFKELEDYVLKTNLTERALSDLIYKAIGAFNSPDQDIVNALKQAKEFLKKYPVQSKQERPLFMSILW
jgi:outer membrane protein assembly factor BamD (BamD/ComL family)